MMRIIYLKILCTGIFLLILISVSYSAEWVFYAKTSEFTCYFDKDNIQYMPDNIVRSWDKIIYSDDRKKEMINKFGVSYKDLEYSLNLTQINCKEKMQSLLNETFYDSKGSVIEFFDFKDDNKFIILPDSIAELLYKIVCEKTK
jgi:hypothetical protein